MSRRRIVEGVTARGWISQETEVEVNERAKRDAKRASATRPTTTPLAAPTSTRPKSSTRNRRQRLRRKIRESIVEVIEHAHNLPTLSEDIPLKIRVQRLIDRGLWELGIKSEEQEALNLRKQVVSNNAREAERGFWKTGVGYRVGGQLIGVKASKPRLGHARNNGGPVRS